MPERKEGTIVDMELRENVWWYLIEYDDGTTEWVPEYRLEEVKSE